MTNDSDFSHIYERRTVSISQDDLERALKKAVYEGCKAFVKDQEIQRMLGESMYKAIMDHGSKDAKIWVGGKILAALATMLLAAAITFYVRWGGK